MTSSIYLFVRLVHVLLAAVWFGGLVLLVFFVMPSIAQSGPAGGQVMGAMVRRGFTAFMPSIAGITVLSGILLYWRFTGGFDMSVMHSHAGVAFATGGLFGLVALILGSSVIAPGSRRLVALGGQMASMSDGPDKAALMQRMSALRQRIGSMSRIVLGLVTIAMVLMTLAHYV